MPSRRETGRPPLPPLVFSDAAAPTSIAAHNAVYTRDGFACVSANNIYICIRVQRSHAVPIRISLGICDELIVYEVGVN